MNCRLCQNPILDTDERVYTGAGGAWCKPCHNMITRGSELPEDTARLTPVRQRNARSRLTQEIIKGYNYPSVLQDSIIERAWASYDATLR